MNDTLITAVFTFAGIVTSGVISVIASSALVNWRLKEIERRLVEHNGYAAKFGECTVEIKLIKQDMKYVKEKLEKIG